MVYHPQAKLLVPPTPPSPHIMLTEENWPLLTVAKGAFDNLDEEGGDAGKGWGDEAELEIDEGG